MLKNRALTFIVTVLSVSVLYSLLWLKFPYVGSNIGKMLTPVYMFIPLLCALVLQKAVYKEPLKEIGFSFKWTPWYFLALVPIALAFLTFGISLLMPGVTYSPDMSGMMERFAKMLTEEQIKQGMEALEPMKKYYLLIAAVQAALFGISINAVFGFGEEAGWRGFLLNALKEKGFMKASLIIGLVWGVWHAPVIIQGHNYPDHRVAGVFMMILWCILLSPLFTYIVLKTKSAISAAMLHGVLNASPGITYAYIKGGSDLTVGFTGAAGMIALVMLLGVLFAYDKYFAKEKVIF
jgi:uncharacterized protein